MEGKIMRHSAKRSAKGKQHKKFNKMKVFDSNGPDVRIRGTAWQVTEKYEALAKDAETSGNYVLAENYRQHAEHYQRIINSFNEETPVSTDKAVQHDKNDDIETPMAKVDNQEAEMAAA